MVHRIGIALHQTDNIALVALPDPCRVTLAHLEAYPSPSPLTLFCSFISLVYIFLEHIEHNLHIVLPTRRLS